VFVLGKFVYSYLIFISKKSGLYYKDMTIVNDATSWSITLESPITLLELSIMLTENIYSTGFTHDDRNILIVQAGNTKGGSITVPLTSCLESAVCQMTIFVFIYKTD
jgi:hypothetical protein